MTLHRMPPAYEICSRYVYIIDKQYVYLRIHIIGSK